MGELKGYLDDLGRRMHLEPRKRGEVLRELETHIEDHVRDLQAQGVSQSEALSRAVHEMGEPQSIAGEMHAVHNVGSWKEVFLASLPHIMLSLLFALHLWTSVVWVVLLLIVASFVAFRGWRADKPKWAYSWLGYSLAAPALSCFLALITLGYGLWSFLTANSLPLGLPLYLAIVLYIPFSLWLMMGMITKIVRQDWLLASLASLPIPFLAIWLYLFQWREGLLFSTTSQIQETDGDTALVFLAFGLTTAVFLKVGQRAWRITLLLVTTPILVALALTAYRENPHSLPILLAAFVSAAFILSPALLEPKGSPKKTRGELLVGR